ncbi:MAG: hypothetical protein NC097_02625 [Clostridium sp.]|nr:hypothetical protein [Prevotella sp.]MCM1428671.1 hypothetical protein [Clostridium sp.]MCM1475800.1 hypothetical protein [Muribaculaceae bacterium]
MKKTNNRVNTNDIATNNSGVNHKNIGLAAAAGAALGVGGAAIAALSAEAHPSHNVVSDPEFDSEEVEVVEAKAANEEYKDMEPSMDAPSLEEDAEALPPEDDDEPEVEVLGFDHMEAEDGSEVDVAVLRVDGHAAVIMDANQDGEADFIAVDINDDGIFSDDEQIEITGQGYSMQPYLAAAPQHDEPELPEYDVDADDSMLAETDPQDMPDFINDADVADFDL